LSEIKAVSSARTHKSRQSPIFKLKFGKAGSQPRLPLQFKEAAMQARDVMTFPVITVKPTSSVKETANLFLKRRISAAPVVDDQGKLVGIISEGDLTHRAEIGTERQRP
jgi:CBS domain-containing protein